MAKPLEALFWSIAFPGFGQYANGKLFKGTVFLILEFVVNVQGNFNKIIQYSFLGEIEKAIQHANYQWLLFYPCLYFFSMWDAWKDAGGGKERFSFLPFAFAAYFVTVGCIYSPIFRVFGVLIGPVWLPIFSVLPGVFVGLFLKRLLQKRI